MVLFAEGEKERKASEREESVPSQQPAPHPTSITDNLCNNETSFPKGCPAHYIFACDLWNGVSNYAPINAISINSLPSAAWSQGQDRGRGARRPFWTQDAIARSFKQDCWYLCVDCALRWGISLLSSLSHPPLLSPARSLPQQKHPCRLCFYAPSAVHQLFHEGD